MIVLDEFKKFAPQLDTMQYKNETLNVPVDAAANAAQYWDIVGSNIADLALLLENNTQVIV